MSENKTCCPNCGSTEAVPKEVAWDALASIPPKTQAALLAGDELARVTDACLRMMDDALKGTGNGDMAIKPDGSVTLVDGWKALTAYRARRATGGDT